MTIKTEFILPSTVVMVTHEPTTGEPGRTGKGLVVIEPDVAPDTLTTIEVRSQDATCNVYLLWRPKSWHLNFSLLVVQETSMLFIGGGTFSAVIDMSGLRVVRQHKVLLFWSFQHTPRSILELGEDECFLYQTNGELVGSVPVDPPYDIIHGDDEVEFVTSLFGRQRIPYPSS